MAVVLGEPDPILALGAIVADELYGTAVPIVTVGEVGRARIRLSARVSVAADAVAATGWIELLDP